ncbi:hypothetical protein FQA39_LY13514 [Lamprigera yunnana]|nr:hypothetical protein FQA39_LY13514 [Lamprigera yunnana]
MKDNLKQCVHSLITNISDGYDTVLFYSNNPYNHNFYNLIKIPFININARGTISNLKNYKIGRELVILSLSKNEHFGDFVNGMHAVGMWSFKSTRTRRFVIILPLKEFYLLQRNLLLTLWSIHTVEVVFLYHNKNTIRLFTSDPQHPHNECGRKANFIYEYTCNSIKKIKFPKLWRNYKDCKLIYWYTNPIEISQNTNEMYFKSTFLLDTAVQHLHLTLVTEKLMHNFTITCYGFRIFVNQISWCNHSSYDCSIPFLSNELVWIVPPPKIIDALEVFKITFKGIVWILITLSFLITSLVWWFIVKRKAYNSFILSFLDIYSATLFGFINRIPPFLSPRLIFIMYVLYAVHIQTAFTSQLIRLLTVPQYDHSITSLEELAQSRLPIFAHETTSNLFQHEEEGDTIYNKIKKRRTIVNEAYIDNAIVNKENSENYSILISSADLDQYIKLKGIKLHYIKDDKYLRQGLRYGLAKSGIMEFQERNYKYKMKNYTAYYDTETISTNTTNIVLSLAHVYPIFVYWGTALIICTVVFVLEILIYNITENLKN